MRVLLTALGSYGDVYPMIGLGAALAKRGHEALVLTNPHFQADVSAAGLRFVPVAKLDDYDRLTSRPELWHRRRGLDVVFRDGAVAVLDELYETIVEHYEPGQTVLAAHGLDLASRVAAESLGAPVASVVYAPMALWSDASPPRMPLGFAGPRWLCRAQFRLGEWLVTRRYVNGPLNRLRRRVGLGPLDRRYFDWYYGVAPPLCLFPEWFAPDPGDWPAGAATTGFPLWDGGEATSLSAEVEAFLGAGEPPVAFTPGSANRHAADFFAAAAEACERSGRRGVLLTKYREQLPTRLPDSVRGLGFPPLSRLLPRCAAFVHHGGIGSSSQALAAGVPQLIQPLGFDQHDNASRLRRLGVAEEIDPRRFTAPIVNAALDRLTRSDDVRRRCAELAERCDADEAFAAACETLERRFDAQ